MSRLTSFLLGVVVGAVGLFTSENYYIVRSDKSFYFVPKVAAKLEFPYYDIRTYTVDDWNKNPALALAIVKANKQDLLTESGMANAQEKFEQLLQSFGGGG